MASPSIQRTRATKLCTPAVARASEQHATREPGDPEDRLRRTRAPPASSAQVQQRVLGLPEHGAVVLFWVNPNIDQPRLLLPRGVPGSASFEVSPDNADLLDSLVASCVQYCCPTDCPCEEGHMSRPSLKNIWLQLPAFGALMLGALLAGGARADRSQLQPPEAAPEPSRLASRLDQVAIRIDGENIYISQRGSAFEELRLGDTPDAAHLRKLLRDAGAVGQSISVPIGSMIVASGGGSGTGAKPKQQSSKETTDPGKGK